MSKPSLPKGTRDFSPTEVNKRKYIFQIIEEVFRLYGYQPLETPAMESLDTLTGKYGEEGDRLLFKILNNGDFLIDVNQQDLSEKNSNKVTRQISKKGLRYDLTVPFARFVAMNQSDIKFPFKRYQIQPVWRGDRPSKGRYQEFFQCDVDVVGSDALIYEAELVNIYSEIFKKLGLSVKILINNRKVLYGIAETAGVPDKFMEMTIAIDKLDKIGEDAVIKEMVDRGIALDAANKIVEILKVKKLEDLKPYFSEGSTGSTGVKELDLVFELANACEVSDLVFDISLARGLSYYTGCIFEVKVDTEIHPAIAMGSIGGGGRYDNLTGVFGLNGVSGVGVSLGAERIYDVLDDLSLFPQEILNTSKIIFLPLEDVAVPVALRYANVLRSKGIACEVYPEAKQMKKQMKYANDRGFAYAVIIGQSEIDTHTLALKEMASGTQQSISINQLIDHITQS